MKYIRTKDFICRVAEDCMLATNPMKYAVLDKKEDIRTGSVSKKNVLKVADTIDALCDFIVIKYHDMKLPLINSLEELFHSLQEQNIPLIYYCKWLKEHYGDKLEYIKLAISTDKGITCVAQLNEKGELELL